MADRDRGTGPPHAVHPTWQELLDGDARPVPATLRDERFEDMGSEPLDTARYTDPEFFRREIARMWPNVWQFAAREEDLPDPGDYVVYENAGRSYLVSRQDDGSIKAMHNVCLHRGRKLRSVDGNAHRFVCPFHGFAWNKDGGLSSMPCPWDFPHLTPGTLSLPEAEVGRWGGYIFVRDNPGGPNLAEFLDPLPEHFKRWRHEDCTTVVWVGKVVRANWKTTMEAFMESLHIQVTHPQIMPFTGDINSSLNVWGDNVSGNFTPFGTISPSIDATGKPEQWIVDEYIKFNGRTADSYDPDADPYNVQVAAGQTARQAIGEALRAGLSETSGLDLGDACDVELIDALVYNVFPNFSPWGGFMPNIVYRWRPWPDQDHTLMEVRVLMRVPEGQPRPRGIPMRMLGIDEPWTAAKELGVLGNIFEQDMENIPYVQEGLKFSKTGKVQLSSYQESRIRQIHRTLDKYLDGTSN